MGRYRTQSPLLDAIGTALRSGDPEFVALAMRRLRKVIDETGGNLMQIGERSGIPHRTLCRWLSIPPFRAAVEKARAKNT